MISKSNVLDYWLSCVREQDIQKTSLTESLNRHQFLSLEDENTLLSNQRDSVKIILSESLKDILRRERARQLYRNNKDSRPVFFFPLVTINGQSLPLFYVDLIDLESKIISGKGDLSFEINPWSIDTKIGIVSDTFVKLGYDEENIDLGDSIISFIEKITGKFTLNFQLAMKDLLECIQNESASSGNSLSKVSEIQNVGLIKYSDFSEATLIFKKDLLFIKENPSLLNSTMIDSFIVKKSKGVEFVEEPFMGGFFDFPVSKGQSLAISEVLNGERDIVSVQGGPGTGKTTLILSTFASIMTQKAISISKGLDEKNGFILVTSFTNKAVENVANIIEKQYGKKYTNWLCLQLGNREKRELASERINALVEQLESDKFDRSLYEKLKAFIVHAESRLSNGILYVEEDAVSYTQEELNLLKGLGFSGELSVDELTVFIAKVLKIKDGSIASAMSSLKYSINTDEDAREKLEISLIIHERSVGFYKSIVDRNPDLDKDLILGHTKEPSFTPSLVRVTDTRSWWERFVDWLYERDLHDRNEPLEKNIAKLDKVKRIIKEKELPPYEQCLSKALKIKQRLKKIDNKIKRKKVLASIIFKVSSSTTTFSSLEKSRLNHVSDHKSIFDASLLFIYQHILKNKTEVIDSILAWQGVLKGNGTDNKVYHNRFDEFVHNASLPFPVITCTLSSLGTIFDRSESTFMNHKPFSLSVCDEAGMVPIFCMPSILMRSKKSLVIGDQKQLSPILSIDKNRLIEFKNRCSLHDPNGIYNPMLSSAFQRSAFASKSNFSDIGESVILDEHRRCQKRISDCFIEIGGYEMISNHTPVLEEDDTEIYDQISKNEITLFDVQGGNKGKRNTNTEEIIKIKELLDELEEKGIDIKNHVGIITPFQNQSVLLQSEFRRRLGHTVNDKKIGTVHAFQGSEFDIIILSMVAFNDKFHTQFISKSPNLLNVAISRAKNRLLIVGDRGYLSEQDGNIEKLLKHCP